MNDDRVPATPWIRDYARHITPVSPAELEEAYLVNALVDLHQANWGVYGVRKLWHAARRAGHEVGRDQVGRLMGIARISGAVRDRHRTVTTRRRPVGAAAAGPGQARLGRAERARPAMGGGLLLRVDAGRVRLRSLRRRRVLPPDPGRPAEKDRCRPAPARHRYL